MKNNDRFLFRSLLANKDFRDWVHNPTENRNHYWEKWMKANEDKKDLLIKARNAVTKLRFKEKKINDGRLEDMLTKIISSQSIYTEEQSQNKTEKNYSLGWWLMIASFFILLTVFMVICTQMMGPEPVNQVVRTIQNPVGQECKIRLPDGSIVNLNSESTLSFPSEFSDTLRWVELNGEAFFEVLSNNQPFIVKTDRLEAYVYSATFQVNAYHNQDETGVALLSGKLRINATSSQGLPVSEELTSGEKLHYNKVTSGMIKTFFKPEEEIKWAQGLLVLQDIGNKKYTSGLQNEAEADISDTKRSGFMAAVSCSKNQFLKYFSFIYDNTI